MGGYEKKSKDEYYGPGFLESIKNLSESELREQLNLFSKKDHKWLPYNDCTWVALQDLDKRVVDKNHEILPFYSRKNRAIKIEDCGASNDQWNREHVYPSGRFRQDNNVRNIKSEPENDSRRENSFAFNDLHHLVATDVSVNGKERGNLDFGDVGDDAVTKPDDDDCKECKRSLDYFQPGKGQRGEVARKLFYMDIRYDNDSTLNLRLQKSTTSGEGKNFALGDLYTLLKWHCQNAVSPDENVRNNGVQSWQGNRNPFIDYPELVEKIYGKTCKCILSPRAEDCESKQIKVRIISALVNPEGDDQGKETVTIKNYGNSLISLTGWTISGNNGNLSDLEGKDLGEGETYKINGLGKDGFAQLTNRAASKITLYNNDAKLVDEVTYDKTTSGVELRNDDFTRVSDIIKVRIVSALVNPNGSDTNKETVTIENFGSASVNLAGWTVKGNNDKTSPLEGIDLAPGKRYVIKGLGAASDSAQLKNKVGSKITLFDGAQIEIDQVTYDKTTSGVEIRKDNFSREL